jgi:hypothetical protein
MPEGFATPVKPYTGITRVPCVRCGQDLDAVPLAPVLPWQGESLIDATEHSRAHDQIHTGQEAFKLEYARLNGELHIILGCDMMPE